MSNKQNIVDGFHNITGFIQGDTYYDKDGKIIGYRSDNKIVDSRHMGRILYTIHDNGDITEGTSHNVVFHIHSDGTITEGTGRHIAGYVDGKSSASSGDSNFSGTGQSSSDDNTLILIIAGFLCLCLLYFSIFKLPGLLVYVFSDMSSQGNTEGIVTLTLTLAATVISCIYANRHSCREHEKFKERLATCYGCAVGGCYAAIVLCGLFTGELSLLLFIGGMLISAIFAVLPTIVICVLFCLIEAFRS